MKTLHVVLLSGLVLFGSGCIIDDPHHCYGTGCTVNPLNGDISFDWLFWYGGANHYCDETVIDVRSIHVEITDITNGINRLEFSDTFPCSYGGVTIYDFVPGVYNIYLSGTSLYDDYRYEGSYDENVSAGLNSYGALVLE